MKTTARATDETTLHAWTEEGRHYRSRRESSTWAIARWLQAGRDWDKGFVRSSQITGYSVPTLYNLLRTADAFEPHEVVLALSFSAHRELTRETDPEKRRALHKRAVLERWTQGDVIAYFRETEAPTPHVPSPTTVAGYKHVEVCCPECRHVFPVRGHKVAP